MRRDIADTAFIREMQATIDQYPPGAERDKAQRKLDRVVDRLRALPARVALQAPFADRAEAHGVLSDEIARVIAAIDDE
jgi:hypothetical protein